ncbi:signal recognition particle 9 kDa protein-domain-containing protein [Cryomyces antarcticus]
MPPQLVPDTPPKGIKRTHRTRVTTIKMPYFETSQEWVQQSALLLKSRPTTTRVTTKYTPNPNSAKAKKRKTRASRTTTSNASDAAGIPQALALPKASLTLKTYDPESGVCLKYRTGKAAEVGRLVASLGRLGRSMAALPDVEEDVVMADIASKGPETGTSTPLPEAVAKDTQSGAVESKSAPGGGGGKKKKKGKK